MISFLKAQRNHVVVTIEDPTVPQRPLTRNERDYLERTKASLDAALQALLVTLGLLALPIGFLIFTMTGRGGWSGDKLSTAIAGTIMLGLVAAVVYYTALGRQEIGFDRRAFKTWRGLGIDLAAGMAEEQARPITGKVQETLKRTTPTGPNRAYYLVAGELRFKVSASTWMAHAEGEEPVWAYAPHSGVLLAVDADPDRLRLPRQTEPESGGQPIGGG